MVRGELLQFEGEWHPSRCYNILYVKVFEANFDACVLEQSCVFPAREQGLVNVLRTSAYHVSGGECERGGFGVSYAYGHGCKFGRVEITVDEFL